MNKILMILFTLIWIFSCKMSNPEVFGYVKDVIREDDHYNIMLDEIELNLYNLDYYIEPNAKYKFIYTEIISQIPNGFISGVPQYIYVHDEYKILQYYRGRRITMYNKEVSKQDLENLSFEINEKIEELSN